MIKKKRGLQPLSVSAMPQLKPVLQKAGFAATEVITQWEEIVGPKLARRSQPLKISFPKRPEHAQVQDPGTLHIIVETAFSLEMQHMNRLICERVNTYFGWNCVQAVKLKTVPYLPRKKTVALAPPAFDAEEVAQAVHGIEDAGLRAALERLGRALPQR